MKTTKLFIQKLNYAAFLVVGICIGLAIQLAERKLSEPKPAIYSLDLVVVDAETGNRIEYLSVTQPDVTGPSICEMAEGEIRMIWESNPQWEPSVIFEAEGYEERAVPLSMIRAILTNSTTSGISEPYTFELERSKSRQ